MSHTSVHVRQPGRGKSWSEYWPLFALIIVSLLAGIAITVSTREFDMVLFMHGFMGVFLIVFALLKLFDPRGFRNGFAMYDLLAMRASAWGYVYPFIELALGLSYLAFTAQTATYIITIIVFSFGALGVLLALRRGLDIACPCMGNILKVPLSTVTLTEDIAMIIMAALLLADTM